MLLKAFAELPPRKRIGIIAILLGIFAAVIGNPCNKTQTKVNIKEVALKSEKDVDKISVTDLAEWIIQGKMDYRLVDLRSEDNFSEYNIPTSENINIASLTKASLKRNDKIILYSKDDVVSAQGWFILKASDYKSVNILKGGIEGWKNEVVFPHCSCGDNHTEKQMNAHQKKEEIAKFFGGEMETSGSTAQLVKKELPKLKAPTSVTLQRTRTKKKREGC